MGWSALPNELEDLILDMLPVVELARISRTCSSFSAASSRRLIEQQKACCDLALAFWGRDRIQTVVAIAETFLKGERLNSKTEGHSCIFGDGVCGDGIQGISRAVLKCYGAHGQLKDNDTKTTVHISAATCNPYIFMHMGVGDHPKVDLMIDRTAKTAWIWVYPQGDDDLVGVGFVLALLSGSVSPLFHDGGLSINILVTGASTGNFSVAGLQAQVAPLMPMVSSYRLAKANTAMEFLREFWRVGSGADKGVKLHMRSKGVELRMRLE
jgi:hypothetical protein